mmetsp:Transcript_325/g.589  ORF Transcript_325/g.589 Transcript_325/m.589 type:complete len:941 (+) Transcript_325:35-2857(+)
MNTLEDPRPIKKKKFNKNDFIDSEAHDSGDDSDENYSRKHKRNDLTDQERKAYERYDQKRKTGKNLLDSLAQRYQEEEMQDDGAESEDEDVVLTRNRDVVERQYDIDEDAIRRRQQSYERRATKQPTKRDPHIFRVKCRPGVVEQDCVMELMHKYLNALIDPHMPELFILSISANKRIRGHIFIEALQKAHVDRAVDGMHDLVYTTNIIKMPIDERTQLYDEVPTSKSIPKVGNWVKVKRLREYTGDYGKVIACNMNSSQATVQLIPRVKEDGVKYTKGKRPPQRPLDSQTIARLQIIDPELIIKGNFIQKTVPFHNLHLDVKPPIEFAQKYSQLNNKSNSLLHDIISTCDFKQGDRVHVIKGGLIDVKGVIKSVNNENNTAMMLPDSVFNIDSEIEVSLQDILFDFEIGSVVGIVRGKYAGETGIVILKKQNTVIVNNPELKEDREVFISDIDLNRKMKVSGKFSTYDMVKINNNSHGVVISNHRNQYKVIDETGKVVEYSEEQLLPTNTFMRSSTSDTRGQLIHKNDRIRVINGSHAGRSGIVKHIFRHSLFIQSQSIIENAGIIVIPGNKCEIKSKSNISTVENFTAGSRGGRRIIGASRRIKCKDEGKTVRIIKGQFKGYNGVIKGGNNSIVRIALHSKFKTVKVGANDYKVLDNKAGMGGNRSMHAPLPATPYVGHAQTPMRSGSTPIHTPGGYDDPNGLMDRNVPNTPGYPATPGYYSRSNMPAMTPGNVMPTPRIAATPGPQNLVAPTPHVHGHGGIAQTPGYNMHGGIAQTPMQNMTVPTPSLNHHGGSIAQTPHPYQGGPAPTPYSQISSQPMSMPMNQPSYTNNLMEMTEVRIVDASHPKHNEVGCLESIHGVDAQVNIHGDLVRVNVNVLEPTRPTEGQNVVVYKNGALRRGDRGKLNMVISDTHGQILFEDGSFRDVPFEVIAVDLSQ